MTKRNKHTIIITMFLISALSVGLVASVLAEADKTSKFGKEINEVLNTPLQTNIIAEIDGTPISASTIEYKRLINNYNREYLEDISVEYDPKDYPVDDNAIIMQIAKELFVIKKANEVGISYSDKDIMDIINAEELHINTEIEKGNKQMIQRQSRDNSLLQSLDMTKEQFYETLYIDALRYTYTLVDYCKYYYGSEEFANNTTFESYLDEAFANSSIMTEVRDINFKN